MNRFARYRWYRRMAGGHWLHSLSCGWFPVTERELREYLREMPSYVTGIEDNTRDDAILNGALVAIAVLSAVLSVGLVTGVIPL